jgi:hypothetical protein
MNHCAGLAQREQVTVEKRSGEKMPAAATADT